MAFLKRLSDSLWNYVSPQKASKTALPTPQTGVSVTPLRKSSLDTQTARFSRSMSPTQRVLSWNSLLSSQFESPVKSKRKSKSKSKSKSKKRRLYTPDSDSGAHSGRQSKQPKIDVEDLDSPLGPGRGRLDSPRSDERDLFLRTPSRKSRTRSPSPSLEEYIRDDDSVASLDLDVDDDRYNDTPPRKRTVVIPKELKDKNITEEELREAGWDDDYITLIQRIGLRGREPVFPAYMKFEYRFMPDGLFAHDDEAFVGSVRNSHFKASKAIQRLFDLGGHVRDCKLIHGDEARAELEVQRHVKDYIKWAETDSGLDMQTAIPVLVQIYEEAGTPGDVFKAIAEAECRALAKRWKKALQVARSVEFSPASSRVSDGTLLSYELPTLYALVACDSIVAFMAYRADTDECTPMAFFNYNEKDYDVWNSLALAILVCHVRNVQLRIAEDTEIGLRQPNSGESSDGMDVDA